MLSKLAIWYLRKKKKSVLIGYELNKGKVRCLNNVAYVYDNEINDIKYSYKDGTPFNIPEGKFNITVPSKSKQK